MNIIFERNEKMKKTSERLLSVILAVVIILTAVVPSFAYSRGEFWENLWNEEYNNGVVLFPGSDNSEMNVSWYSETESTPKVLVTEELIFDNAKEFTGYSIAAPDGDFANKVTITGLEPGKTYRYKCISEGFESNEYFFETDANEDEFSAIYMTDIHISHDDNNPNGIKESAMKFNSLLDEAVLKSNASILLSAGDQASVGYETEYKGLASAAALKMIPIATTIGNHDRKHIAYKTFNNVPNEDDPMISSYVGSDYWFTKGDVLFLVMDSNNASGIDHRRFVKDAVKANPRAKWKVMMAHHDLYSGRLPHRESENELLRLLWAPIADEFKIDLVLLGHSHYYTVSNVMYNNEAVQPYSSTMTNPKGTVYMVSGSITRPRNDSDLGLNEEWIGFANTPDQQAIYNVLDFTSNSITVSSYYQGQDEAFNSYKIEKSTAQGGHPNSTPPLYNMFIRFIGTVYAMFNNIGVYNDLKDAGVEVNFFEALLG